MLKGTAVGEAKPFKCRSIGVRNPCNDSSFFVLPAAVAATLTASSASVDAAEVGPGALRLHGQGPGVRAEDPKLVTGRRPGLVSA